VGDLRQVVERHIASFNARDEDAFPWVDDIEFVAPGASMRGREEVLGFMRGFWEAFPDARVEAARVIEAGSSGAGEGTFMGTHTGVLRTPNGEVPPTEKRVEFRWCALYEIDGDRMRTEHLYFDQAELMGQLGLMPG
jgi:predicted ester cyclase